MALKKIGDMMAGLGKYQQNGEEKTRWGRAGTLFQRDDGSMVAKIDMIPIEGSGWLAIFEDKPGDASRGKGSDQGFRDRDAGQKSAPARAESDSRGAKPDPRAQQPVDFEEDIPF